MTERRTQLDRAFNPRTVAVVGDKQVTGYMWLRALQPFTGRLYSVQIDPSEIPGIEALGVTNVRSLLEIADEVDYVVVAVPRGVVLRVLADCARKRVGAVTLFTAGFAETGDPDGIRLEQEIQALAQREGLLVVGPNCMGIANLGIGLRNFDGQPAGPAAAGPVAFVGQSGTHTITFCARAALDGIGISKAVSFGNGIVLDASDYVEYLRDDPATTVIAAYIEGVRDGRRLYDVLRATTPHKPVVLWKGGSSEAGRRAIFSHTASLASPTAIWQGMQRQAGVIGVESQEALLDVARTLVAGKVAQGYRAGLIAMTGGPSVAITDAFTHAGLSVPLLSDASYARLAEFFQIVGGSFRNPLDVGSTIAMGMRADNLARLLDVLDTEPAIDVIGIDFGATLSMERWLEYPELLTALVDTTTAFATNSRKPVAVIADAPQRPLESAQLRSRLQAGGAVPFTSAPRAAEALRLTIGYHRWRSGLD